MTTTIIFVFSISIINNMIKLCKCKRAFKNYPKSKSHFYKFISRKLSEHSIV